MSFLLPQPPDALTAEKNADFSALLDATPPGSFVDYRLPHPKWQFLSCLCEKHGLVLHGSQTADIAIVEPRKASDVREFSMQEAIYATTDGIWAIFFAIVDRKRFAQLSLFNSCVNIRVSPDLEIGPLYFFSITHAALLQQPWCDGVVYILPRETFLCEPAQQHLGAEINIPHWVGFAPVQPAAKLRVEPRDFPFLAQVHGHDDQRLVQLSSENPEGFPWPDALVT